MKNLKYIAIVSAMLLIGFITYSCSDDDDYRKGPEGLVQLEQNKSFSLLTITLSEANVPAATLADFTAKYDPAVMVIKNITYDNQPGEFSDAVTEVAYLNSFSTGQPRQGIFSETKLTDGKNTGVGIFVKNTFSGTDKMVVDDILTLHIMNNILTEGDTIKVVSCEFDRENTTTMEAQANALKKYAEQAAQNTIIAASIYTGEDSPVITSLQEVFNLTCTPATAGTDKRPTPEYLLTPRNQNWGVKYASIVGDESVSMYKGLFFRVGLTK